jgi:hypothetical protein
LQVLGGVSPVRTSREVRRIVGRAPFDCLGQEFVCGGISARETLVPTAIQYAALSDPGPDRRQLGPKQSSGPKQSFGPVATSRRRGSPLKDGNRGQIVASITVV